MSCIRGQQTRFVMALLALAIAFGSGCVRRGFTPTPEQTMKGYYEASLRNPVTNKRYTAFIEPVRAGFSHPDCRAGLNALEVTVTNIGPKDIVIDWARTLFLREGRADNSFSLVEDGKPLPCGQAGREELAPTQKTRRTLLPCSLLVKDGRKWNLPFTGEVGVLLAVETPDGETAEAMTIRVGTVP